MIGEKIKELRIKKDMTQSELGKIIGVSSSTIGMYEQNRRQPDISTLIKIADYYNVTTDFLLDREDKPNNENKNDTNNKNTDIHTIAAHQEGEEYTDEEKEDIENFIKNFVLNKRKK